MGKGRDSQANLYHPEAVGILESPSYFLLNEQARKLVDRCADEGDVKRDSYPIDLRSAILNRRSLVQALEDGEYFLTTLDPATFLIKAKAHEARYEAELDVIEGKLKLLNYLIIMSAERAKETRNLPVLPEHEAYRERVGRMHTALRRARGYPEKKAEPTPLDCPKTTSDKDGAMRYFGMLNIVPVVQAIIENMTLNQLENYHDILMSYNGLRLYFVWANALAQAICNVIARSVQQALPVTQVILNDLALATGSLGYILYFTTFGISASIVLQNTLSFGLTKKVRDLELGWYERFKTQWDERKFLMLNNAVWGLVNFVCFFWLVGQNILGFWGNVLTGVLFIADLFLVWWQYEEAKTEHEARLSFYDQGIDALSVKIKELSSANPNDKFIARLMLEHDKLQDTQKKLERDWRCKVKQHELNLMYGVGVIIGFTVLCSFFFPPALIAPFTAMILTLTGAAMCFGFGVAYKALSGELIIQKEVESRDLSKQDYKAYWSLFKRTSKALEALPDDTELQTESKLLYLGLKKSMATELYQTQMIEYQKAQIICNVLTDIILPTLFLLAFVFMPLGIGMPIFAVGLVALFYAHWQVAEMAPEDKKPALFKTLDSFGSWLFSKKEPEEERLEQFDQSEYNSFCARVNIDGDSGEDAADILCEQLNSASTKALPEWPHGGHVQEGW
tara:strand:+ start:33943 stop:35976 length:2034 start_codon:yes stop_codon:yes gene_type:complete